MGHPAGRALKAGRTKALLGQLRVDEGEPEFWVTSLSEVGRGFAHDNFERWPDLGAQEVASPRGAVGQAEDDVDMDLRVSVALGDVAQKREQLALLIDLNAAIVLGLAIEPAHGGPREGPDAGELRRVQMTRPSKLREDGHDFFTGFPDEDVALPPFMVLGLEGSDLHGGYVLLAAALPPFRPAALC